MICITVAECSEGFYCTGGSFTDQPYANSTGGGDICPRFHYCEKGKKMRLVMFCVAHRLNNNNNNLLLLSLWCSLKC